MNPSDNYLVGIGASVGGLDAIKRLFEHIPAESGMAFVVIQHLSPDYKSLMPELLAKHTSLKIYTAKHNQLIEPNCIYLNQSKKNLLVKGRKIQLSDISHTQRLNLPIDLFFESLGEEYQEKSIGIILSGTGADGTRGLKTIKEMGGTVMAQEPTSAQFSGMPNSAISTNLVDFILDPAQMALLLAKLTQPSFGYHKTDSSEEEPNTNDELFYKILNEVHRATGIDFKDYKKNTLVRRLEKRININGIDNLKDYHSFLKNNPNEKEGLMQDFLIGVTSFYRDGEAFNIMREKVIPKICQSKSENDTIRVWVPGCSTGEEVFSIGMLFDDYIAKHNLHIDFKIFATDVDSKAISRASSGVFGFNIVNEIDEEFLEKYFVNSVSHMEIKKAIREKVVFSAHNILKDPPFIRMDLISCRNLMIYLDSKAQKKVLSNFQFALNKYGYLFLGNSESVGDIKNHFKQIDSKWKIYQNLSDAKPLTTPHSNYNKISNITQQIANRKTESMDYRAKENPESAFHRFLSNRYSPSCIFIDKDYNILFIKGEAGKRLTHSEGLFERNLLKVVDPEMASVIRNGINRLDTEKKEVVYQDVAHTINGHPYTYDISFYHPDSTELHEAYVIEFSEDRKSDEHNKLIIKNIQIDDYSKQRIAYLEDELKSVKTELQNVIEELETSNEELQSSNEELMSSNEELQGTNEELQAANEELYTVNAEFQEKNRELNELNNDINNLLNSTDIGTLFLDNELKIRKFTPALQKHFKLRDTDLGRPITSFASNFHEEIRLSIIHDSQKVLKDLINIEKEIVDNDNNHYLKRISPFVTSDKKIDGVVITFVDINQLKKAERELHLSEARYKQLFDNLNESFLHAKIITDGQGEPVDWEFIDANQAYANQVNIDLAQINGRRALDLFPHIANSQTDMFKVFGKTALTGKDQYLPNYLGPSGRIFMIHIFSPAPGEFAATSSEVTQLIKAREEIKHVNQRLELANAVSGTAIWEIDVNANKLVSVNHLWENLYGFDNTDMTVCGNLWRNNIHHDDLERILQNIKDHLEGKTEKYVHEFRYKHPKTGADRWISDIGKVIERNANGSPARILGVSVDVTERKIIEEKIKENEQKFRKIFENSPFGMVMVNNKFRFIAANSTFCDMLGFSEQEILGMTFKDVTHPDDVENNVAHIKQLIAGEIPIYKTEKRYIRKDGETIWVALTVNANFEENGKFKYNLATIENITFQKKAELRLKENAEKIEAQNQEYLQLNEELTQTNLQLVHAKEKAEESDRFKTAFLQNISHEIRTPLNAIMGFSDLIKRNFNNKEKLETFASIIVRRSNDLLDIINDIIDISKIESGQLPLNHETFNLHDLFSELGTIASELQKNLAKPHLLIQPNTQGLTEVSAINTDKGKLKQILINLLSNAIKYTEKGNIEFGCEHQHGQLLFFVYDTGIGMPNDKKDLIFERFVRLEQTGNTFIGGTGLGLSIVKGLVNLLGGNVWVESEPDLGSKFFFTIPFVVDKKTGSSVKRTIREVGTDPFDQTILIVEDDPWNAEYLKEVLTAVAKTVMLAETGHKAIETAKTNHVDLILMDVQLPDMTGYDTIGVILANQPDARIILQTAYASHDEKAKALAAGCVDYLSKPIKQQQLLESVYAQLTK